jgi:hypothetical protein
LICLCVSSAHCVHTVTRTSHISRVWWFAVTSFYNSLDFSCPVHLCFFEDRWRFLFLLVLPIFVNFSQNSTTWWWDYFS